MDSTDRIQAIRNALSEIEEGLAKFGRKQETAAPNRGTYHVGEMRLSKMIRYANEDAFLALTGKLGALREMLNTLEAEVNEEIETLEYEIKEAEERYDE